MLSHDGRTASAKFRWVIEIKSGNSILLSECFFLPEVIESKPDPLLRTIAAAKQPQRIERRLKLDFLDVTRDSDVYLMLNSLTFDKHYEIKYHLHEGSISMETWNLSICRILERLAKGQPNGLFTISLVIEYHQIASSLSKHVISHIPGDTNSW